LLSTLNLSLTTVLCKAGKGIRRRSPPTTARVGHSPKLLRPLAISDFALPAPDSVPIASNSPDI